MRPEDLEEHRGWVDAARFGVGEQRQATLTKVLVGLFEATASDESGYVRASWKEMGVRCGMHPDTFRSAFRELERSFAVVSSVYHRTLAKTTEFAELKATGHPQSNALTILWDRLRLYAERHHSQVPSPRPGGLLETEQWDGFRHRILLQDPLRIDVGGSPTELSDYLAEIYEELWKFEEEAERRHDAGEISFEALVEYRVTLERLTSRIRDSEEFFRPSRDTATFD